MVQRLRVVSLADHLDLIEVVAEWHWTQWGHLDPDGSLRSWTEGLAGRTHRDRFPTGYVAMVEREPVGSVVLVEHDMPDRQDLAHWSPWLAGLFVVSGHRRQGIASALVKHAETEAIRFGVHRLHAYTSTTPGLYERLGWTRAIETTYEGQRVTVLVKDVVQSED